MSFNVSDNVCPVLLISKFYHFNIYGDKVSSAYEHDMIKEKNYCETKNTCLGYLLKVVIE